MGKGGSVFANNSYYRIIVYYILVMVQEREMVWMVSIEKNGVGCAGMASRVLLLSIESSDLLFSFPMPEMFLHSQPHLYLCS